MRALLDVTLLALDLYWWAVVIAALLSWFTAFNVINARNEFVYSLQRMLAALTEPLLQPIRRILPPMGGLDISPIILLMGIFFVERVIQYNLYPLALGY